MNARDDAPDGGDQRPDVAAAEGGAGADADGRTDAAAADGGEVADAARATSLDAAVDAGGPLADGDAGAEPSHCPDGAVSVNLTITTPEELARLRGCERVTGNLSIQTLAIESLADLAALREVTGQLSIFGNGMREAEPRSVLRSLAGLESLSSVGDLSLDTLSVPDLRPLSGLSSAGGVGIDRLPALQDLAGLEAVRPTYVRVANNAALRSIAGLNLSAARGVVLDADPLLEDISSLQTAEQLQLSIYMMSLPSLKSLSGMSGIRRLEKLSISDCTGLHDLAGLEGLSEVDDLALSRLSQLRTLAGLQLAKTPQYVWITDNPLLESLDGATGAGKALIRLTLQNLPALQTLGPLQRVETISFALVEGCDQLRNLAGLEQLSMTSGLVIRKNAQLQSLHELRVLRDTFCLEIQANPSLPQAELDWIASQLGKTVSSLSAWPLTVGAICVL